MTPSLVEELDKQARDAARYRFIRMSEAHLTPEQEEPFAKMWQELYLKGCDGEKMDAAVDAAMSAVNGSAEQT